MGVFDDPNYFDPAIAQVAYQAGLRELEGQLVLKPNRMMLLNLDTGESLEVQYNPSEVSSTNETAWADLEVPGLSHQPAQFKHTKNVPLTFELFFYAGGPMPKFDGFTRTPTMPLDIEGSGVYGPPAPETFGPPAPTIQTSRTVLGFDWMTTVSAWLESLTFPRSEQYAGRPASVGLPLVEISWGTSLQLTGRIRKIDWKEEAFNGQGDRVQLRATVNFVEELSRFVSSEEVARMGRVRPAAFLGEQQMPVGRSPSRRGQGQRRLTATGNPYYWRQVEGSPEIRLGEELSSYSVVGAREAIDPEDAPTFLDDGDALMLASERFDRVQAKAEAVVPPSARKRVL